MGTYSGVRKDAIIAGGANCWRHYFCGKHLFEDLWFGTYPDWFGLECLDIMLGIVISPKNAGIELQQVCSCRSMVPRLVLSRWSVSNEMNMHENQCLHRRKRACFQRLVRSNFLKTICVDRFPAFQEIRIIYWYIHGVRTSHTSAYESGSYIRSKNLMIYHLNF